MSETGTLRQSTLALALYQLLNPIPLGCFVAAWIFDIIYVYSVEQFWTQGASWLIVFGLLIAVVPRLINLFQVWVGRAPLRAGAYRTDFWLNLLAVVLAIFNAFIHSRDGYAVVPLGAILSTLTVLLLLIGNVQLALRLRAPH